MSTLAAELAQGQVVQYRAVRSLSVAGALSVGIVIATPSVAVVKDLLLTCTHLGLEMTYKIAGVAANPTASNTGSDYVLTILSPHSHVPATCYRDFCQVLSNFHVNITKIINLSDKNNKKKSSAVEFVVNVPAGMPYITLIVTHINDVTKSVIYRPLKAHCCKWVGGTSQTLLCKPRVCCDARSAWWYLT